MKRAARRRPAAAEPIALHHDAASGVTIATFSDDRGTPERRQHGSFTFDDVIDGREKVRAMRAVDTLSAMLRNGSISEAQYAAGSRFRNDFAWAHLDPLRAADVARLPGRHGGEESMSVQAARERIVRHMVRLGGHGSPLAQAAWWVAGYGLSTKEFARRMRWGRGAAMHEKTAAGLLLGALTILAASSTEKSARS